MITVSSATLVQPLAHSATPDDDAGHIEEEIVCRYIQEQEGVTEVGAPKTASRV
jgi:hypothetical protein